MNRARFIILVLFITVDVIYLHIDHVMLDSRFSAMVKSLSKYRAIESEGRCYKLELPEDFGSEG